MPWVRLDEQFPDHPKVLMAGPLAAWLHVCGLAYCNRMTTDGFIPFAQVGRLVDFTSICISSGLLDDPRTGYEEVDAYQQAERLVDCGIWEEKRGGFEIHDYLDYQPSRAEIEAQRKVKADAGRKGGLAKARAERQQPDSKTSSTAVATARQSASNGLAPSLAKTYPDPDPDPDTSSSVLTPTEPAPTQDEDESQRKEPHPDEATLDHIANTIGWTTSLKRAQLATEWDYGRTLLDPTPLEDALLRCTGARSANYLHGTIRRTAADAGITLDP